MSSKIDKRVNMNKFVIEFSCCQSDDMNWHVTYSFEGEVSEIIPCVNKYLENMGYEKFDEDQIVIDDKFNTVCFENDEVLITICTLEAWFNNTQLENVNEFKA